jgi:hypothetical protein
VRVCRAAATLTAALGLVPLAACSGGRASTDARATTTTQPTVATTTTQASSGLERTLVSSAFARLETAVATAAAAAEASPYAAGASGRADADNYVRQLAQIAVETELVVADPNSPQLIRDPDPFTVATSDPPNRSGIYNPDNVNYVVVVNGQGTYRITGKRGNSADLTFQAITGFPGDGSVGKPTALLALNQLKINADDTYTIDIAPTTQTGNWLPTVAGTSVIAVRDTFAAWTGAVPDQVKIERLDAAGPPMTRLPPASLSSAIDRAASDVMVQGRYWSGFWSGLLGHFPPNSLIPPATTQSGLQNQVSVLGHFRLAADQALVVTVARSNSAYQGFEVADPWGQTLPYATHESSLTAAQAQVGSDGLIHYVVSGSDPGVPNWIDTAGHDEGFLFLRWQGLTGALPQTQWPTATLVNLSDLTATLPAGTPRVSPPQRTQSLAARAAALTSRIEASSDQAQPILRRELVQLQDDVGPAALHTIFGSNVP